MNKERQITQCCPPFDPTLWDNKEFDWNGKRFVKSNVFTFCYIPINFGPVIKKVMSLFEKNEAKWPDWLCLSDHTSKWNMDLYCAADKEIKGIENVIFNGKFISKVYEGDFKLTQKWCDDYAQFVKDKGLVIDKMYMWYTTCPKCAKKYGKNYVVIVSKVKSSI